MKREYCYLCGNNENNSSYDQLLPIPINLIGSGSDYIMNPNCYNFHKECLLQEHDYNFIPSRYLPHTSKYQSINTDKIKPRYFGIEFEFEVYNYFGFEKLRRLAEEISEFTFLFYFKHDGSLKIGSEAVTHPFTWKWLNNNNKIIKEFINVLYKNYALKTNGRNTCGLHIHVTKFKQDEMIHALLTKFISNNIPFFKHISDRNLSPSFSSLEEYASLNQFRGEFNSNKKTNLIKYFREKKEFSNRYTAVNFHPFRTIEFRLFSGILKYEYILKNIEFVKSLFSYLQVKQHGNIDHVTLDNYLDEIKEKRNLYPHLYDFLNNYYPKKYGKRYWNKTIIKQI